ncbi:MAG TPA: TolC family protein [Gemmatimonadales bacterium]|nr:TolC family protein [Gemmatimonadales bacterium]
MRQIPSRPAHQVTFLAAVCLAALAVPHPGRAQQSVTREQVVAAALARGPRVALAAPDTAAARAELISAREFQNPVVSASYSKDVPQYHATVELPLDYPWLRGARVRAAAEASTSAVLRFRFERASARFDAEAAYADALAAAAHALLSRHTARDADSLLRMAVLRREAGDASELDVQLATVNAGQLVNDAASDSAAAIAGLLEVQRVMGLASDQPQIALADTLAPPATDTGLLSGPTLQVASADAAVRSAEAGLALARRSVFAPPSLTFGFDTHDPTPGGETGILPTFGLALTFPLFNFNGGAIAAAAAARDRAAAELRVARQESDAAVARARRDLAVALQRAQRDRQLVASADRVAAMSLTAYAEGAVALPSVLEAQRQAREAFGRLIDDLAAANLAESAVRLFTASEASP